MRNHDTIEVSLWPRIMDDLEVLRKYGIWGSTIEEVAANLIIRQVQDLVAVKVLPLEHKQKSPP